MSPLEIKNSAILALVFAFRMLGLFMIIPVLSLHTNNLSYVTPMLIGLAMGIHGLSQAALQIPLGALSDRIGRRKVVIGGLLVFIIGSLIAANSSTIWGLLIGRALQGAGAIGSTLLAWAADLTSEHCRTRAMAIIGISIGAAFVLAFLVGPIIAAKNSLAAVFAISILLSIISLLLVFLIKEQPKLASSNNNSSFLAQLQQLVTNKSLWTLNFGIFALHAILGATFLVLPARLLEVTSLAEAQIWRFYAPVLFGALLVMGPCLRYLDKSLMPFKAMALIMAGFIVADIVLLQTTQIKFLMFAGVVFFAMFNLLEATLPALVSKVVGANNKGAALGVFSCAQFLGIFVGSALGGVLHHTQGKTGIIIFSMLLSFLWCVLVLRSYVLSQKQQKLSY